MAEILDGKKIAAIIKAEVAAGVNALKQQGLLPHLAVVLAGDDPASEVYARSKEKVCAKLGIEFSLFKYNTQISENELLHVIDQLNADANIHGIMIELPLPPQIDKRCVLNRIDPIKDVDGMQLENKGRLFAGAPGLFPATPQSCIEILKRSGVEISGRHVVVVGRGEAVGKPLIPLLLQENATVTVCHSRTIDLPRFTKQADILISAVGKAKMITAEMIKPEAVIVDAGINECEEGICGDVDFAAVSEKAGMISPVPGGVGALTTALLMMNLLKGIRMQRPEILLQL